MGFIARMGEKLGLYRTVQLPEEQQPIDQRPTEVVKRTVTLQELRAQMPDPPAGAFEGTGPGIPGGQNGVAVKPKTDKPPTPKPLNYDLGKVYDAAKVVAPPSGWSIEKVIKLLKTDQFKSMPADQAKQSLLGMLAAESVSAADVVKDAIARDKALDAFELHLRRKLGERRKSLQTEIDGHRNEIEALRAAIGDLEKQVEKCEAASKQEEVDLQNWIDTTKREREEELARAVGLLSSEPVISVGQVDPAKAAPEAAKPQAAKSPPATGG